MLNLDENKLKIIIEKLNTKADYRNWSEGLRRYLRTRSLDQYLDYQVQVRMLLSSPNTRTTDTQLIENLQTSNVLHIPLDIRDEYLQKEARYYTLDSADQIPLNLLNFIEENSIIVDANKILILCNKTHYVTTLKKVREEKSKIFSIFHSTISSSIYEIIRQYDCVYKAYSLIENQYKIDTIIEQQNLRKKISNLYFTKLNIYLEKFDTLLAEYVAIGGSRYDTSIYDTFVQRIKVTKYNIYYNLYNGSNIDDLLNYFRPIAMKDDLVFQKYQNQNNNRQVNINRTSNTNIIGKRCQRCNGWNHSIEICPTTKPACFYCGSIDHFKKDCPNFLKRIKAKQVKTSQQEEEENDILT